MIKLKTEVSVGIMVMAGFVLLSFIVFGISGIYFFRPGYSLQATFNFIGIIDKGAPVRYAGVKVGEVKKVEIIEAGEKQHGHVRVTLFIVEGVKIYEHDKISILGTHIMAEPHVAIEPAADNPGRLLKNKDIVQGNDPISMDELIREGREITLKINQFLGEMETVFRGSDTQASLRQSLVNMSELVASMNKILHGQEDEIRAGISGLGKSVDQLSLLLEKVNKGEGTLGKLVVEDELYNEMRQFVQEIKRHPWRLLKK